MKPIVLYGGGPTPNPIKVAILLEELGLPFEVRPVKEIKAEPYISINPNGRLPSIEDPNTGVKVFESGAILEYLEETYDTENKFQLTSPQDKWALRSWLYFQVSGQGPYFGQIPYFKRFFGQPVAPNVIERFEKEAKRVTGVIDAHLKKTGTKYLVGDTVTYADIAFIPWYKIFTFMPIADWKPEEELPHFGAWIKSLQERPAVQKVYAMDAFQKH
jgi:glutathione S-transferase